MHEEEAASIMAATVMPDHMHVLLQLGERLTIGQLVGKLKAKTKTALAQHGLRWQENFYEHRLRPDELANGYAFYIFMNPYRAGLIKRHTLWPYWQCPASARFDFQSLLEDGLYPPREWVECDFSRFGLSAAIRDE